MAKYRRLLLRKDTAAQLTGITFAAVGSRFICYHVENVSPAARSGLRKGDRLIEIDGMPLPGTLNAMCQMFTEHFNLGECMVTITRKPGWTVDELLTEAAQIEAARKKKADRKRAKAMAKEKKRQRKAGLPEEDAPVAAAAPAALTEPPTIAWMGEERRAAAIRLQSAIRIRLARKKLDEAYWEHAYSLLRQDSAERIQRAVRGRNARLVARTVMQDAANAAAAAAIARIEQPAATLLQKYVRKRKASKELVGRRPSLLDARASALKDAIRPPPKPPRMRPLAKPGLRGFRRPKLQPAAPGSLPLQPPSAPPSRKGSPLMLRLGATRSSQSKTLRPPSKACGKAIAPLTGRLTDETDASSRPSSDRSSLSSTRRSAVVV